MGLDELKDKYRAFPIWARLMMALIIGIAPGACSYFDEVEAIESRLLEEQTREEAARTKFEASRKTKSEIPKLVDKLEFTEDQIKEASKRLPQNYLMESILSMTATNAKQVGLSLTGFKPSCELKAAEPEFKYVERAIDVSASGKFQQLASFFDKMVHSETMLFIRDIVIEPHSSEAVDDGSANNLTPYQVAELSRRNLTLNATFKVVVYRAMKPTEEPDFQSKESCESVESTEELTPAPAGTPPAVDPAPTEAPPG